MKSDKQLFEKWCFPHIKEGEIMYYKNFVSALKERDEHKTCKNCKCWNEEQGQCNNDIVWLNKPVNVFFNISDLKTNWYFGCNHFEEKP